MQDGPTILASHSYGGMIATRPSRTTVAAWRTKSSWHAVSEQDRTINPD